MKVRCEARKNGILIGSQTEESASVMKSIYDCLKEHFEENPMPLNITRFSCDQNYGLIQGDNGPDNLAFEFVIVQ